jgi:hypothetical protein
MTSSLQINQYEQNNKPLPTNNPLNVLPDTIEKQKPLKKINQETK